VACQDGEDNDSDGKTDCHDTDCQGFIFCLSAETTAAACQDGEDNDSDGQTDCDDTDCQGFIFCLSTETTAAACQDGEDNDSDGQTDCDDTDCQGFIFCLSTETTAVACQDGEDNDSDDQTDCDDADCQGFVFCYSPETTAAACQDDEDNDSDGFFDCDDTDCQGFVFCHSMGETTAAACQDDKDNDSDGDIDCDDIDCQGFVFCATFTQESTLADCSDELDNDYDGDIDCDDIDCWHWGHCHVYNGYPLVDSWGETWDGMQRPPRTWSEARDICLAVGGRLPTATELYRVNASASGTGEVGIPADTAHLWTLIADYQNPYRVVVRLSDGHIDYYDETSFHAFRCVWPNAVHEAFSGDACHGTPGEECRGFHFWWNVDQMDRPPMHSAAAVNECMFYKASITTQQDFSELVQSGWANPTNNWLWLAESKYWYDGGYGQALGRWSAEPQPWWGYDRGTDGGLAWGSNSLRFRCIGKRNALEGTLPAAPACMNDNCFTVTQRRATLIADNEDRLAANLSDALTTCHSLGASLPRTTEFTELIHAGWGNGSNSWLWTGEQLYWYNGGYGFSVLRWSGTGTERWYVAPGSMERSGWTTDRPYRCVWRENFEPAGGPTICGPHENQIWSNNDSFTCEAAVDGDSNGHANPVQAVDGWGNAWDLVNRSATDLVSADAVCRGMRGRLPTATELWRVRGNQSIGISIGTSTTYLWTITPEYRSDRNIVIRLSDGGTSNAVRTSAAPYRCVWPSTKGDAFGGRSCYAYPADSCFQVGNTRMDRYDRPAVSAPSAAWECAYYGGRLPIHDDFVRLVRAGAPNGTNSWLWMNRPMYWYNNGWGYAVSRWSDLGSSTWIWESGGTGTAAVSWEYTYRHFRCVFSDEMD
jgi:hypothetical protein